MKHDNKNFILAIVLSMLIIFGWQYFYAAPIRRTAGRSSRQASQQQTVTPGKTTASMRRCPRHRPACQHSAAMRR